MDRTLSAVNKDKTLINTLNTVVYLLLRSKPFFITYLCLLALCLHSKKRLALYSSFISPACMPERDLYIIYIIRTRVIYHYCIASLKTEYSCLLFGIILYYTLYTVVCFCSVYYLDSIINNLLLKSSLNNYQHLSFLL